MRSEVTIAVFISAILLSTLRLFIDVLADYVPVTLTCRWVAASVSGAARLSRNPIRMPLMGNAGDGNAVLDTISARVCATRCRCAAFDSALGAGVASWKLLRERDIVVSAGVDLLAGGFASHLRCF